MQDPKDHFSIRTLHIRAAEGNRLSVDREKWGALSRTGLKCVTQGLGPKCGSMAPGEGEA